MSRIGTVGLQFDRPIGTGQVSHIGHGCSCQVEVAAGCDIGVILKLTTCIDVQASGEGGVESADGRTDIHATGHFSLYILDRTK